MKLPIPIEYDSLRYYSSALIDFDATPNFASQEFLVRNGLLGNCVRGRKISGRIANEQRISTNKSFSPASLFIHQIQFTSLAFIVLPHLKCVDFIFGSPNCWLTILNCTRYLRRQLLTNAINAIFSGVTSFRLRVKSNQN